MPITAQYLKDFQINLKKPLKRINKEFQDKNVLDALAAMYAAWERRMFLYCISNLRTKSY